MPEYRKESVTVRDWLSRYSREAPATFLFALLAIVVWTITAIQSRSITYSLADSRLGEAWILWGPTTAVETFGVLRAVTAIFLHVDLAHLAINMFLLVLMGREIEKFCGTALYTLLFPTGGIGASAFILWQDPLAPTAGASGALYALMAIFVVVSLLRGADLRAPLALIAVNIGYTFLATSVSLWGHLGGLFTGILLALLLLLRSRRAQVAGVMAVLFAAVIGVFWLAQNIAENGFAIG